MSNGFNQKLLVDGVDIEIIFEEVLNYNNAEWFKIAHAATP